tara:strand:+ start:780 stop:1490 length:711 start_codon:yes stop_codon:yes gene_type:complete
MSFKCIFCEKYFSSKGNLKIHQTKTKYCLEIQNNNKMLCKFCNASLDKTETLETHYSNCIEYHKKLLKDSNDEIRKLKKEIILLKDTKDVKDTRKINLNKDEKFLCSLEQINAVISEKYSEDYLILGQKGLVKFIYEHILVGDDGRVIYTCIDENKEIFNFKNTDEVTVTDIKAKNLIKLLNKSNLKNIAHQISCNKMTINDPESFMNFTDYYMQIQKLESNSTKFRQELIKILRK